MRIFVSYALCPVLSWCCLTSTPAAGQARASFCRNRAMIEQLAFEFFEYGSILLGPDPERPGRWLIRCPDCGQIRSVRSQKETVKRQTFNCKPCGLIKLGLRRRTQLPTSDDCIILEQYHEIRIKCWCALVVCPDCETEYVKPRRFIIIDGHTICGACIHRRIAKPLPQSEKCIIIHEFAGHTTPQRRAFVECPHCHKQFEKQRRYILRDKHTICHYCSMVRGEAHPYWIGGAKLYRGPNWSKIRKQIRERDNHTCQWPGCVETSDTNGRMLAVHHVEPYRVSQDSLAANLICLCSVHHGYAERCLDESIPLLQSIVKERLEKEHPEKTLVSQ